MGESDGRCQDGEGNCGSGETGRDGATPANKSSGSGKRQIKDGHHPRFDIGRRTAEGGEEEGAVNETPHWEQMPECHLEGVMLHIVRMI